MALKDPTQAAELSALLKRAKYGNKLVRYRGMTFHSKLEFRRYCELVILQKCGKIYGLARQVPFRLIAYGDLITTYIADFEYYIRKDGIVEGDRVIEDTKGYKTEVYELKRKLMKAIYNISIREVFK